MNGFEWLQLIVYFVVLLLLVKPLGLFMAHVFQGERTFLDPVLRPVERLLYRAFGVSCVAHAAGRVRSALNARSTRDTPR